MSAGCSSAGDLARFVDRDGAFGVEQLDRRRGPLAVGVPLAAVDEPVHALVLGAGLIGAGRFGIPVEDALVVESGRVAPFPEAVITVGVDGVQSERTGHEGRQVVHALSERLGCEVGTGKLYSGQRELDVALDDRVVVLGRRLRAEPPLVQRVRVLLRLGDAAA